MIKNGYYYPIEMRRDLNHFDSDGKVVGKAQLGLCFGNRTGGKTVGWGIELLKNFMDNKESFMILAKTENQKSAGYLERWMMKILRVNDSEGVIERFKSLGKIVFTNSVGIIDDIPFVYCEAISMSHRVKDEGSYERCTNILLDEAVQVGDNKVMVINRRPAMVRIFEIWQTVARGYEGALNATNLIFIANTSERDNWVFRDLKINAFVRNETKYTVQRGICFQMVNNKIASKAVEESMMGLIMSGSESGKEYYEAAQMNAFNDNLSFIKRMGLNFSSLIVQLVSEIGIVGVFETDDGVHIAKIEKDDRSRKICNNISVQSEDVEFIPDSGFEAALNTMVKAGKITYQDIESKNNFLYYMNYGGY